MNRKAVKCCNILALQAEGSDIVTIEGIANADGSLHPMQVAFREHHGLQCGFCTPGMVMSAIDLVRKHPNPSETQIRAELDGNLCRCTGYHGIVKAVEAGAKAMSK
jgi:carbon-monoxide dehydrogenase small subunit